MKYYMQFYHEQWNAHEFHNKSTTFPPTFSNTVLLFAPKAESKIFPNL